MKVSEIIARYQEILNLVDQTAKALQDEFQPYMQCKKGCSSCCISTFKIRYIEALPLLNATAGLPTEIQAEIFRKIEAPTEEEKKVCPLLINGSCSVYQARPLMCRAYGVIINVKGSTGTCPLNFQSVPAETPLKTLSLDPYYEAIDELDKVFKAQDALVNVSGAFSDHRFTIREFFQKVLQLSAGTSEAKTG
jgi:uncharacterized protein